MTVSPASPRRQFGFTLLEGLLSIGIIAMLAGLSLPVYASFQNRTDLDIATQGVASALRRAQVYARGVSGDSQWSVEVQSTAITLFKGTNFGSRDATYDEAIIIPNGMTVSGLTQVQFSKRLGIPNTTGSITLTARTNDTRTVTINAEGMVEY